MVNYGVLKGPVADFGREDDHHTPHFQVRIETGGARWRVPVNVESSDGSEVLFAIVEPLVNHRLLGQLAQIPEEFTPEDAHNWFLDYLREPMFDITAMRALPSSQSGPDNDLQDLLTQKVTVARRDHRTAFAFGSQFPGGVHDIHMNQGNPVPGPFAQDNGIHQDGGLIVQTGAETYAGVFLAFQTQLIPTDDQGAPQPGAAPIQAADTGGNTASQAVDLSILAACVNPLGDDVGKETVILLNASAEAADLSRLAIQDKNGNREPLAGTLAGGDVRKVVLSGQGAQLGNSGGVIQLVRVEGGGVLHAVSYTAQGRAVQGRTLVF